MKANRKFIQADERAVSAVIGVILMVSIAVAITATFYAYVTNFVEVKEDVVLCGHISEMPEKNTIGILSMNKNIYIIGGNCIGDSGYILIQYAFHHRCNCSLILNPVFNEDNVWYVQDGSVSLLDCGCDIQ